MRYFDFYKRIRNVNSAGQEAKVIPEYLIEQVKDANDIVEVVSSYMTLQRKGANYWAPCPFHDEKTPSFSVSAAKQIYHCFGCGAGGSVINFVMEYNHISFIEAVRELAANAGIDIGDVQDDKDGDKSEVQKLYDIHEWASGLYEKQLHDQSGKDAAAYLADRGLKPDTLAHFHAGWAPPGWDFLVKAVKNEDRALALLSRAGLVGSRDQGGYYDRFRERIMFPVRNPKGNMIAFGGRTLSKNEDAKYLNSPDTPVYHKGKVLYGLHEAIRDIRQEKTVYIVEGYMDYLQLWQSGFRNVAAGSGTAFTEDHARLMKRYCQNAILCYDSDTAGQNAAFKTALLLSREKFRVRILQLPEGEDPDSFLKKQGAGRFQEQIDASLDIYQFFRDYIERYGRGPAAKTEVLERIFEAVRRFDDLVYRELFIEELGSAVGIGKTTLLKQLNQGGTSSVPAADLSDKIRDPNRFTVVRDKMEASQFQLIQIMLLDDPAIRRAALEYVSPDVFQHKGYAKAAEAVLTVLRDRPDIRSDRITDGIQDEKIRSFINRLLYDLQSQADGARKAFLDCMREMEAGYIRRLIGDLEGRQKENDDLGQYDAELAKEIAALTQRLKSLSEIYTNSLYTE